MQRQPRLVQVLSLQHLAGISGLVERADSGNCEWPPCSVEKFFLPAFAITCAALRKILLALISRPGAFWVCTGAAATARRKSHKAREIQP